MKNWDIQINYGIKTGFNEAFIISQTKRDELLKNCPEADAIIRPILRGRDIKKYSVEFADSWILYIPWHFPLHYKNSVSGVSKEAEQNFIANYPDIYNHLKSHKEGLLKRNQAETGIRYEWYALQRSGVTYFNDFAKEKIVWLTISDKSKFALDSTGAICLDTAFFMTGKNIYTILAVLNSRIIEWYFDKICPSTGAGTNQWKKFIVETIPIPLVNDEQESSFKSILSELFHKQKADEPTFEFERQLNRMVLQLYNLNDVDVESLSS